MANKKSETVTYNPSHQSAGPRPNNGLWFAILGAVVLCVLSFYGGVAYEKGHVKTTAASSNTGFGAAGGGFRGRFGGQRPNIGAVTAVSSSSITIQDNFSGSSKTFSITSATTVTNNGASASVSDIQTGDTVLIRTSSSTSTQATTIDINPSFGGGQPSSSSGSSTTDSQTISN